MCSEMEQYVNAGLRMFIMMDNIVNVMQLWTGFVKDFDTGYMDIPYEMHWYMFC